MHIQMYEMYLCVLDLQVTSAQSETVQNVAAIFCRRTLRGLVTQPEN